ncbi:hypothetical protein Hanom_Chr02g00139971 [Helianthus anomalus]
MYLEILTGNFLTNERVYPLPDNYPNNIGPGMEHDFTSRYGLEITNTQLEPSPLPSL